MNLLVTICARAGSKGVKSKNTRDFCGQPIVYFTLAAYKLFVEEYGREFEEITLAVNTDSDVLLEQMNCTGIPYHRIQREDDLAGDVVAKIDVIRDTLLKMEAKTGKKYGVTLDLDITSPLRTTSDIKGTLDAMLKDRQADISFSVTDSRRSPYFNMVCKKEDGYYNTVLQSEFVSRQQVPMCFDMNASIYGYRRAYLLSGRNKDRKAVIFKMRDTAVLDIDSEEDYELLGILAQYFMKKEKDLQNIYEESMKFGKDKE